MAGRPPASGICIVPLPSWQNAALFHIGFKRAVGEDTGGGMGSFRLFCFVSVFSNAELVLQGFLHLPYHRFLFHFAPLRKDALRPLFLVGKLTRFFRQLPGAAFQISWTLAFLNF